MKNRLLLLFDDVLRRWRPPRSLRFTRLGTIVVILTVGIGLGAMNTGNNLVYMIFGMMLGFITASGVLSEMSLRGLEVDWIVPGEIYAGQTAPIRVILRNKKLKTPSFGIAVEVRFAPPAGAFREQFTYLPARSQKSFDIPFVPARRGEYTIELLKIETLFPFGFFRKYLVRDVGKNLIAYPEIKKSGAFDPERLVAQNLLPTPRKGRGDAFWGMKEFSSGDNPRQISWKTSARQAKLMVRETEREHEKKVLASMAPLSAWKALGADELEQAVSFAASFVHERFKEGFFVGFLSEKLALVPSNNRNDLARILTALALFDPLKEAGPSDVHRGKTGRFGRIENGPDHEPPIEIIALWKKYSPAAAGGKTP